MAWALQERDAKGPDSSTKEGHLIPTRPGGFFDYEHREREECGVETGPLEGLYLFCGECDARFRGELSTKCPACGKIAGGTVTYPESRGGEPIAFSSKDYGADATEGVSPTLRAGNHSESHANGGVPPAIAIQNATRGKGQNGIGISQPGQPMYTLDQASHHAVAFDTTQITSKTNRSNPQPGDPCHPLAAAAHPPAIAIQERAICENPDAGPDGVGVRTDDTAYTLEARATPQAVAFKPSHYTRGKDGAPSEVFPPLSKEADRGDQEAVIFESRFARNGRGAPSEISPPLKAQSGESGKGDAAPLLQAHMQVRRLTPLECERLQGFPDHYTAIPRAGKPAEGCQDGPRYKALGNSMAVPVMRWIGQRIADLDNATKAAVLPNER